MTTTAAIIAFGPLSAFVVFTGIAASGLVWTPFAAAITGYLAHRRGLSAGRFALVGAVYAAFLLVPWIQLVVGLLNQRVLRVVGPVYCLLFFSWLVGPIAFWGQYVAQIEVIQTLGIGNVSYEDRLAPLHMLVVNCVFVGMILMWCGSVVISLRFSPNATVIPTPSFRYVIPFMLAWTCTLAVWVYLIWS